VTILGDLRIFGLTIVAEMRDLRISVLRNVVELRDLSLGMWQK
jgi:hypothetical protein